VCSCATRPESETARTLLNASDPVGDQDKRKFRQAGGTYPILVAYTVECEYGRAIGGASEPRARVAAHPTPGQRRPLLS
jgi:hypothetical protein